MSSELNVKTLSELKERIQTYEVDWGQFTPKQQRQYKEHFKSDKEVLLKKIEHIEKAREKIHNYEDDIAEILVRLEKVGFTFIEEKKPEETTPPPPIEKETKRESPVLPKEGDIGKGDKEKEDEKT